MNRFIADASSDRFQNMTYLFRELATRIAQLGAEIGVEITPFREMELPFFSGLTPEAKSGVLEVLKTYLSICEATRTEGATLNDSPRLIWHALRKLGLRPTSDLFNYVTSGNVVEIHDHNMVQIFRNFEFYRFCSYSLEELYCVPWTVLYEREQPVHEELLSVTKKLFSGKVDRVLSLDLPPHVISETSSPELYRIAAKVKFVAPLFAEGGSQVAATCAIEEGSFAEPTTIVSRAKGAEAGAPATEATVIEFRPRSSAADPSL